MKFTKKFFPSPAEARRFYRSGWVVPIAVTSTYADPLEVYKRFLGQGPTAFLDSTRYHPKTATYSFLCFHPFRIFRLVRGGNPLQDLRRLFSKWRGRSWKEFPHFTGGGVGFLSYDLLRESPPGSGKNHSLLEVPKIFLLLMRDLIVFDHRKGWMKIMTNLLPDQDGPFEHAYEAACRRIETVEKKVLAPWSEVPNGHITVRDFRSNLSKDDFGKMVLKAKRYIRAGDIYQANLSQCFSFEMDGSPIRLYERLRTINPSPFSSFLDFGDIKVLSSSPERLIRLRNGVCETRPIAGTKPAGENLLEAKRLSKELLLSEKERAEHLMLLDLERNDLGRVCEYGSVHVDEMMTLEKYSHVIHIVSNVKGKLTPDKDSFDLLQAVFPGGTITGCPKIRCMEIIDELEPCERGLYTGSVGYFDFNGDMDWNIVIRTLIVKGRRAFLQVGAGIVHDSIPVKEYEETLYKAGALLEALGLSHGSKA